MSAASIHVEQKTLDYWLAGQAMAAAPNPYLALFTSVLGLEENESTDWVEVSGGGYARVDVATKFNAANADSESVLNATVEFPDATADWGTVTHFAIMDAASAGNVLFWDVLDRERAILEGDVFRIRVGNLKVTMD